jgi:hypothetical protein
MGSLDDPKLWDFHNQLQMSLQASSPPDWQKACQILNGMSMPDMLDELWRIKSASKLDGLAAFAPRASGVNNARLRAGIGALQIQPPGDFDGLVGMLPADQQWSIMSVCAKTQAPANLNPSSWSKYYWSTRSIPALSLEARYSPDSSDDDATPKSKDGAHWAADIASGADANYRYRLGSNPATYTVTVVYRDFDKWKFGDDTDTELDLVHEPNISVQMSPNPNNPTTYQAAFSLINLHLKRHWGLIRPDVEISLSPQISEPGSGGAPTAALQAQIELHITSKISLTAATSVGVGPSMKPGDPPDYGSQHYGNVSFSPFMIGILGHWDPP